MGSCMWPDLVLEISIACVKSVCGPVALILNPDSIILNIGDSLVALLGDSMSYQWQLDGNDIPGGPTLAGITLMRMEIIP